MKPITLRTKLTLFYTSILALLIAAIAIAYYSTLRHQLDASITEEVLERSAGLRGYLKFTDDGHVAFTHDENDPEQAFFIESATRLFQVYRIQDGLMIAQSGEMKALGLRLSPPEVALLASGPALRDIQTIHGRIRLLNTVLPSEDKQTYLMQVGASLATVDSALTNFLDTLVLVLPVSLMAAAYLGWLMAGRALRPLKAAAQAAEEITAAQLSRRLPVRGAQDELDNLSAAFNRTLSRLESAVGEMKQFTGSIAHELRTPLTVLRGEAEIALMRRGSEEDYRRVLSSQLEEFDKLTQMINQTLILARAESGDIRLERNIVNMSVLIESLSQDMQPVARAKEVALDCDLAPGIELRGDAGWLERMLLNLIDNAIKFTPPHGHVSLQLRREGDFAVIRVADTGRGITPEALPFIFDRFFRGDPSRSRDVEGAGLGLTLVHWIVRQHEGSIDVDSRSGQGAVFSVRLPLPESNLRLAEHPAHIKQS